MDVSTLSTANVNILIICYALHLKVMNSSHGIKRSGSHSYEGDNHKFSKYTHHQSNRNLTEHGNTVHNHGEAQNATATVMSCGGIHHQSSVSATTYFFYFLYYSIAFLPFRLIN